MAHDADDTNLLEETIEFLAARGKTPADVRWCGTAGEKRYSWSTNDGPFRFPWEVFAELAGKTNYDAGFGGQEVASDLLVVGDDWWLERHEYDGSEWWEFKTLPKRPAEEARPVALATPYGDELTRADKVATEPV